MHMQDVPLHNAHAMDGFYHHLDSLVNQNDRSVSIVHIGDSHIQADYLTGRVRRNFQRNFGNAGRGFVFPYPIVRSAGARDVRFQYNGDWSYCAVMKKDETCNIGVSGYAAKPLSHCELGIDLRTKANSNAAFNTLRILSDSMEGIAMEYCDGNFEVDAQNESIFRFERYHDSLVLTLDSVSAAVKGFVLENGHAGVLYHAMGVNGSSTLQYLRSNSFENDIEALNARLVVISFGTNDCYVPRSKFCASCITERYSSMIQRIRSVNPGVSILLTTPPDHYYYRRYPNRNVSDLRKAMLAMAEKENVAVYDLYAAMGGQSSIYDWYRAQLARRDLIHFTQAGYEKQGDMLFEAIMHHYQEK